MSTKRARDLLEKVQPRDHLAAFEPRDVRLLRTRERGELDLTHLLFLTKPLHLACEVQPIELSPELGILRAGPAEAIWQDDVPVLQQSLR